MEKSIDKRTEFVINENLLHVKNRIDLYMKGEDNTDTVNLTEAEDLLLTAIKIINEACS